MNEGYSVVFMGADVTLIKPLPRTYNCYDCDIHIPAFTLNYLVDCFLYIVVELTIDC